MQGRGQGADLYSVLGVESSATAELITSAFRARVRELRPDTRVDAATAARFGEVREAYETLRDPVLRAAYDQVLRAAYDQTRERAYDRERAPAPPVRPARRYVVWLGTARPEPALRVGPVRWERASR
ncbi:DnaJ domain-containing protein [Streptomyces caelestis]|uniref:DnaJ domain-containing protein n=1 Tax=Streptomyces caelestis TaxID=36816 RepID=UPI003813A735